MCYASYLSDQLFHVDIPTWFLHLGEMKQNCALFIITCSITSTPNTIIVCSHETNIFLQPAALQEYANVKHEKGAPLENYFGLMTVL